MKLGLGVFSTDIGISICDLAAQAEDAGLESIFLVQNSHVPTSGAGILCEEHHSLDHHDLDPFIALGAAAAVTSRIKLGTGVCVVPIYDPILLAMAVSTIDHISSGRFLFGIGIGHADTVENHGIAPSDRGVVMREKVLAMKSLWGESDEGFDGQFVRFDPVLTGLRPRQRPHPPVLIGGQGSRGIQHAVDYGDGWLPMVSRDLDLGKQMEELHRSCEAAGRSRVPVTAELWNIDEALMARCAQLGVDRCLVLFHTDDADGLPAFLARYRIAADNLGF